ncbi:hypothetical protein H8Z75_23310 (plasmid) [Xanthomonas citri pv. citri]|nr:hypothetical protein H8Z75_23310 [Xanthomonas citri pv. citri]
MVVLLELVAVGRVFLPAPQRNETLTPRHRHHAFVVGMREPELVADIDLAERWVLLEQRHGILHRPMQGIDLGEVVEPAVDLTALNGAALCVGPRQAARNRLERHFVRQVEWVAVELRFLEVWRLTCQVIDRPLLGDLQLQVGAREHENVLGAESTLGLLLGTVYANRWTHRGDELRTLDVLHDVEVALERKHLIRQ